MSAATTKSVVLTPAGLGADHGDTASAAGRLAATLIQVAVAGAADSARFRRGKLYANERAVTRIEVRTGMLTATVTGSGSSTYRVDVGCPTIGRPPGLVGDVPERSHIVGLAPDGDDLLCSCTCPDWDDPCKHSIAVLLTFAHECITRPELLVLWRCGEHTGGRAKVGARARSSPIRDAKPAATDPLDSDEWRTFVGVGQPGVVAVELPTRAGAPDSTHHSTPSAHPGLDRLDSAAIAAAVVADARAALRHSRSRRH
jgi:hypothetical protein